jgi:hypothetical protein
MMVGDKAALQDNVSGINPISDVLSFYLKNLNNTPSIALYRRNLLSLNNPQKRKRRNSP